ncbi:MAG: hypothetical protein IJA89_04460 [Clostridia bacterium]|nr:hypothetical protein [Clostridia bacterium]
MTNKKKILFITLLSAFICVGLTSCAGCKGEEADVDDTPAVEILPPEITANDEGLFWTNAINATGYKYRINDGTYTNVNTNERMLAYPTQAGRYTLEIVSLADDNESEKASFSFDVATQDVTCQVQDNELFFIGENVYYSVNGGEESRLDESNSLDFSAVEVGTDISVVYYTKGGFWSATDKTYYIDGETKSVSLTVSQALQMPQLTAEDNGVAWTAVANTSAYEITVDGAVFTITNGELYVPFPETLGEHTISVKALANGAYTSSRASIYQMTTVANPIPSISYSTEENRLTWSQSYVGYMACAVDGETFTLLEENTVELTEDTALRLNAFYIETEKTYYLQSKPLFVQTRETPVVAFSKTGVISWNENDVGEALKYSYSFSTGDDEFVEARINNVDVSLKAAGEYTFKVYAGQYLSENENDAVFYVPSDTTEFPVTVLAAPKLDYKTNMLLWSKDTKANGYEYQSGNEAWTATNNTYANVTAFAKYSVRAIGNETAGNYTVNSVAASIAFDPALKSSYSTMEREELARFNQDTYLSYVAAPTDVRATKKGDAEIITSTQDATEQAILNGATNGGMLKITATSASPKNTNLWGNSDGFNFDLFKTYAMSDSAKITFRVYLQSNIARQSGWEYPNKDVPVNLEGRMAFSLYGPSLEDGNVIAQNVSYVTITTNEWVEYSINLSHAAYKNTLAAVTGVSVFFQNIGKEGDVFYLDSVTYDSPIVCQSDTVNFQTNPEMQYAFSSMNGVELVADTVNGTSTTVLKASNVYQQYDVTLYYDEMTLYAGDTISITMKATSTATNGGGIYFESLSTYKKGFTSSADGEWATYTISIMETTVLNKLIFHVYNPNYAYQLYIQSVVINRA